VEEVRAKLINSRLRTCVYWFCWNKQAMLGKVLHTVVA
jgi:hypothetical protein